MCALTKRFRTLLGAVLGLMTAAIVSGAEDVRHFVVRHDPLEFSGWPANEGIWSWGDEILVGYNLGRYKAEEKGHSVEGKLRYGFSRSRDGGLTWTTEDHADVLHYTAVKRDAIKPLEQPLPFAHPGLVFKSRQASFYSSVDRGQTWSGPWALPSHPDAHVLARTSYLVTGEKSALLFLTTVSRPNTAKTERGRSSVMETVDGGMSWQFLSFIGEDPGEGLPEDQLPAYSVMPAAVQLSADHFVAAVRCRVNRRKWTEIHASHDRGRSWTKLGTLERGSSNPAALVALGGDKIAAIYGWRGERMGLRAKISQDAGKTWGPERILRDDALTWDIGYTRAVARPDGALVIVYYYTTAERPQPHIEATLWKP
ncbi:MAG: glycoside hydrolase [Candidatus Didemnitutus sp.]|nr:glycoside hydrolase [Candidatus Didemnitutus sp.]